MLYIIIHNILTDPASEIRIVCIAPTSCSNIALYLLNEKCCSGTGAMVLVELLVLLLLGVVFTGEALVVSNRTLIMASVSSKTDLLIVSLS